MLRDYEAHTRAEKMDMEQQAAEQAPAPAPPDAVAEVAVALPESVAGPSAVPNAAAAHPPQRLIQTKT